MMEEIISDLTKHAKVASKHLVKAVKLKKTQEWKSFNEILALKIANRMVALARYKKPQTEADFAFERGVISGMESVVWLVAEGLEKAVQVQKEGMARRAKELTMTKE